ncbi:fimbria/pilus outer membrane usher protein [Atlantibacter hermannii]|uniref:fimbria/pilus outer membrane usher protein n=1 Tax=Atlantibacter hermannii TaxID=565 RepID=UPI0028979A09|nr:fimbria/pilus outer membrane usher protein [Atlantibacter hermannii]
MHGAKFKLIASLVSSAIICRSALAGEYFDPGLLQAVNGQDAITDTSLISQGYQPPGTYRVHIDVNGNAVMVNSVRFELDKEKRLIPCLSFNAYKKLGVDMSKLDTNAKDNELTNACAPAEEQVPGIKVDFDFAQLKLDINIPQTVLLDESVMGVPEEEWDDGIPALINTYQLSGQHYITRSQSTEDAAFANLTNGINIGRWRFRNNSTLSKDEGWKNISNYVETAVHSLKGELTLGDASTPGDIFDSLQLRGIQLSSDTDMLPDQMDGFAPTIRGIAKSNAQVTVRDHGSIIYQRSVPPGPFVINSLSSVSDGGKLDVTIKEADGSETHTTVAYSSVPQLLRAKQVKYSLVIGHYITTGSSDGEDDPRLVQATLAWGLPLNTTLYGGAQYHQRFKAANVGIGFDLKRFGGIAVDMTKSESQHGNQEISGGKMVRLTYRNTLADGDTQIRLDNRYYYNDYYAFQDWADSGAQTPGERKRREYNLSLNQNISDEHSLYATLSRTENGDRSVSRSWQLGWSASFRFFSLSMAFSMSRESDAPEWDKQLSLTLSAPFSEAYPELQPTANYTATSSLQGDMTNQLGLSGRFGDNEDLNWNAQFTEASQHKQSDTQTASMGVDYQGRYGDASVTYNADRNNYLSWNASGSVIAHRHGITAGRYTNNSMALIAAPGAADLPLNSGQHVMTDSRGYALMPDVQAYRRNQLEIDTHNADKTLDFVITSAEVVPTKDAVVLAEFKPISGRKAVATVAYNGKNPPFGARVKIEGQDDAFYLGDGGQVYLNAAPDSGVLIISWGDHQSCKAPFTLPPKGKAPIVLVTTECH